MPVHYTIMLEHILYQCNYKGDVDCNADTIDSKRDYSLFSFSGETRTIIHILQSTQYIRLHKLDLTLNDWKIILISDNGVTYVLKKLKYNYEENILEFPLSFILFPGLYTLKLEFEGHLIDNHEKSLYKNFAKENRVT
ncbi:hypothetical protein ALC56_00082 [Trachymyrmex septentrionalis]|uniref:Uncharacterized protein n=1 Tax=Trachymyrmex septentrionalis TaxID=34720 RepID=A0A151K3M2_9HYME|nr:hypothetical protein ALC56_00082 [Trachymyrmex septentrionalis]